MKKRPLIGWINGLFYSFSLTPYRVDLFDSKFFANILRDGILVNDDVHRFVFHERFRSVEISTEFIILIPRVFHDIVNRTVLVFRFTDYVHTVIIGS